MKQTLTLYKVRFVTSSDFRHNENMSGIHINVSNYNINADNHEIIKKHA